VLLCVLLRWRVADLQHLLALLVLGVLYHFELTDVAAACRRLRKIVVDCWSGSSVRDACGGIPV
jgi:hypothetical protein